MSPRAFWALLKAAHQDGLPVTVEAVVLAQAWRGNKVAVARLLEFSICESLTSDRSRRRNVDLVG